MIGLRRYISAAMVAIVPVAIVPWSGFATVARADASAVTVPAWVYPLNSSSTSHQTPAQPDRPLAVPGSALTYTAAQLGDLFSAPGWFPESHSAMPKIVAQGRRPDVYACGYCHTPGGQGRPENASLAGLPAQYILQQVADFKSGSRRSAGPDTFLPFGLMTQVAVHATESEVATAAAYFARQHLRSRVRVIERDRVPRSRVVGWVYTAVPPGDEPLGERLMEFAPDAARHEHRDDAMQYLAYVPVGSVRRGRGIALSAAHPALPCVGCHGQLLQGAGLVPRLAGRSPTYLLRQLLAFKTGTRAGAGAAPMQAVTANMTLAEMIDVVAYAASLKP